MATKKERPAGPYALSLAFAVMALFAMLIHPTQAWADTVQFENGGTATEDSDGTITGMCSTVVYFVPLSNDAVDHFDVFMPDGQILRGECIDYGYPTPSNSTYSFTATPTGSGSYSVIVNSGYADWVVHTDGTLERGAPDRSQRVGRMPWTPKLLLFGSIALAKESSDPGITEHNSCYSLEGALFGVFASESDAQAGDEDLALGIFETDENGMWASEDQFESGTYYIKELRAPSGYQLDDEVTAVEVTAGNTSQITVADKPVVSPVKVTAAKHDADTHAATPQGDASLANAEVTFCYYAGYYEEHDLPASPTRTWVMKTDSDGVASLSAGESMKVAGDDFYLDGHGEPIVPLGTITVAETKAPEGYLVAQQDSTLITLAEDADDASAVIPETVGRGALTIVKRSRHLGSAGPAGDATFAGATFTVENSSQNAVVVNGARYDAGETVLTLTANADGIAASDDETLPYGTYTIRESGTSERGYLFDDSSQAWSATVEIRENGQRIILDDGERGISNDEVRSNVELVKTDADTGIPSPQGDATLAGATYEIVNRSAAPVPSPQTGLDALPGEVVCTITTGPDGRASTTAADLNGWAVPQGFNGKALTYGTYEIREARPPHHGYLPNDSWSEVFTVRSDGQVIALTANDPVVRGGIVVGKLSRENGSYLDQGSATLEGWAFEIVNRSAEPVVVEGAKYGAGEVVKTIEARYENGACVASTSGQCLPFGTYEIREIETMRPQDNGYVYDDASQTWSKTVSIREQGQVVDLTGANDACANRVVRGDLALVKAKHPGMDRLAGVPFKVTSATTGEWHVIVTDRNGQASTASETNPHTAKTNGNDAALGDDGTVDEAALDETAGVWFDGRVDARTEPSDAVGALPFDTYVIEELGVEANRGLDLITLEVTVYRDGAVVDLGTLDDTAGATPRIGTSLSDANGNKVVAAQPGALVVDTVSFNNLDTSETYALYGELWAVEGGRAAELLATGMREFSPDLAHGAIDMMFELDTTTLEGRSIVCFERLNDADGNEIASHADVEDEGQTVSVPRISTNMADAATGERSATCAREDAFELVDTVSYAGLAPNRTYVIAGTLHDKQTGAPVTDGDGLPVTASRTFTPRNPEGSIDITFAFTRPETAGADLVAFESLMCGGVEYAVHADIDDAAQTVSVPSITTSLADAETGDSCIPNSGDITLVDAVAFENLVAGRAYTAQATLYDSQTGLPVKDPVGEGALEQRVEFTPESPSGAIEVAFGLDARTLPERTVCFERIFDCSGRIAAVHEDLFDERQSVAKPHLRTTALDSASQTHVAASAEPVSIIDAVAYEGLAPGCAYTVTGTLYDLETEGPVTDAGGAPVSATTTFTPSLQSGTVDVVFECAADLSGKTVVAFESLERNGREYAVHADAHDAAQTVYAPAIETTLNDADTASHAALEHGPYTLVDSVSYKGLQPGQTYTVKGSLHDKGSGEPLQSEADGGAEEAGLTSSVEFTPATSAGVVDVAFELDIAAQGQAVVAFEQLFDSDGRLLAAHEDLDDPEQTVRFPSAPEQEPESPIAKAASSILSKTGDMLLPIALAFLVAGIVGLMLAALSVTRLQQSAEIRIERGKPQHMRK